MAAKFKRTVVRTTAANRTNETPPAGAMVRETDTGKVWHGDDVTAGGVSQKIDGADVTTGTVAAARLPDLSATYATAAQGALADSATQPGDNISTLTNDSGFTSAGATGDAYASSHESDTTAHTAANIVNVPAGNIAATTVQAAIDELDAEKSSTSHTHAGVYEPVMTAASQAEMEAGTQTALRSMSPLRVKQAIDALAPGGGTVDIEDEGTPTVSAASTINFTGAGVTVADAGGGEATVTISGSSTITTSARDMYLQPFSISDTAPSTAAKATASYTLTNNPSASDTVTFADDNLVGSFTVTFGTDVTIGGSIAATIDNLVAYLMTGAGAQNYYVVPFSFTRSGNALVVTSWTNGAHGNSYFVTFDIAAGNPTNNGANLTGGVTGISAYNRSVGANATYSTGNLQASVETLTADPDNPATPVVSFNYLWPTGLQRPYFLSSATDPLTEMNDNNLGAHATLPYQWPIAATYRTSEVSGKDNLVMAMYPALDETGKDAADPYHYELLNTYQTCFVTTQNGVAGPNARALFTSASRAALNAASPANVRTHGINSPLDLGHFNTNDNTNFNPAALDPAYVAAANMACQPLMKSELEGSDPIRRAITIAIGPNMQAHSSLVGSDAATVVWPAWGRDADTSIRTGYIPYGALIVLKSTVDVDAVCDANGYGDITRKLLHALQDFGAYHIDGATNGRFDFYIDPACDSSTRTELQTQMHHFRRNNASSFTVITNNNKTDVTAGGGTARASVAPATFTGTPGSGHNPSTGGGAVASVFGRTGTVVANAGDYVASQVTNDSTVVGATVKDALEALRNGAVNAADYGFSTTATAAENLAAMDAAIAAARAGSRSLFVPGGTYPWRGTFSLSGHDMTTDSNGTSGEDATDMLVWFDNTQLALDGSAATVYHECKGWAYGTGGTPTGDPLDGYLSVSDLVLRSVEPWDDTSEAPIVTGVVAGTSVGVKKYCVFDTRGIKGTAMHGRLHIKGTFDGTTSDNIVAAGCSQRGLGGSDGQRVTWPVLVIEDMEIGLYGTPRLGTDASTATPDDGFADCFTASFFPHIETRGNIGRAMVIGPNKMDGSFIARATFEGATATSRVHQTAANFGSLRINHKVRNTTQYAAMEITKGDLTVTGECYVRNNGSGPDTKGAAWFFRVGDDGALKLNRFRYDNTTCNSSYPSIVYVGTSQNGLINCNAATVDIYGTSDIPTGSRALASLIRVEIDQSPSSSRIIEATAQWKRADLPLVDFDDSGSSTTTDRITLNYEDDQDEYIVASGMLVPNKPKMVYRNNTRQTINTTTTLTTILDHTVPQYGLRPDGGRLRAVLFGDCGNAGTSAAGFRWLCSVGGTTYFDTTTETFPVASSATDRTWKLIVEFAYRGGTAWEVQADLYISEDGSDTTGKGKFSGWLNQEGGHVGRVSVASVDLSSGSAQILVQVAPTVSHASTQIRKDNGFIERI